MEITSGSWALVEWAAGSTVGGRRAVNEDAFGVDAERGLFVPRVAALSDSGCNLWGGIYLEYDLTCQGDGYRSALGCSLWTSPVRTKPLMIWA